MSILPRKEGSCPIKGRWNRVFCLDELGDDGRTIKVLMTKILSCLLSRNCPSLMPDVSLRPNISRIFSLIATSSVHLQ